ncbi:hypothetical protein BGZ94_000311 [Podila epigama]|nr:hypothetical protein BGZ94_000311 [Podila epigama]
MSTNPSSRRPVRPPSATPATSNNDGAQGTTRRSTRNGSPSSSSSLSPTSVEEASAAPEGEEEEVTPVVEPASTGTSDMSDDPGPSSTHIVIEHSRDGVVKTHVYAAKANGQPSDLTDTVLGQAALPRGDPTWSSHGPHAERAFSAGLARHEADAGNNSDTPVDPVTEVTTAVAAAATDTQTVLSAAMSTASKDVCNKIESSAQSTIQAFKAAHAEAMSQGESRGALLVSVATATELDRQIQEQIKPRLDEIVQYVSTARASAAAAANTVAQGSDVHAGTSAADSVERQERDLASSPSASQDTSPGSDGISDPALLEKLSGIEDKIGTIYRVVVDGDVPMSSGPHVDATVADAPACPTALSPEETETLARFNAMRHEMASFPEKLQQANIHMESLIQALDKGVPCTSSVTMPTPLLQPEVKDEAKEALDREIQEENVRWKASIDGMQQKHYSMLESLIEKIEESRHTNKLTVKTFWLFMRSIFHHTKDMEAKVGQIQQEISGRAAHDQGSHSALSTMLTTIQDDLQSLASQLPSSLAHATSDVQGDRDLGMATIESENGSLARTSKTPAAEDGSVHDATPGPVTERSMQPKGSTRSLLIPIPGPGSSTRSITSENAAAPASIAASVVTEAAAQTTSQGSSDVGSSTEPDQESKPENVFPGMDHLMATISSLQENIATMMEKYTELCASLPAAAPPASPPSESHDEATSVSACHTEKASETQSDADNASEQTQDDAASSSPAPSTPPQGKPAEGYLAIPRSVDPQAPVDIPSSDDGQDGAQEELATTAAACLAPPPASLQDLESMSATLDNLTELLTTNAMDLKAGQKFLHSELQSEILKVLYAIHPPQQPETREQRQERESQQEQARQAAETEAARKAEEYAKSLEHISMIPNLMTSLEGVNFHLASKLDKLHDSIEAVQVSKQLSEVHRNVENVLAGSIEDSSRLDSIRTLLDSLPALIASNGETLVQQITQATKSTGNTVDLVDTLKETCESTMTQTQQAILLQLAEWHKKHDDRCEIVDQWHKRQDDRSEGFENWQKTQDERYSGFDQWRLLYNDQCEGQDQWRQRVDDRHAEQEEWQKRSLELLERIEQAPRCRCCSDQAICKSSFPSLTERSDSTQEGAACIPTSVGGSVSVVPRGIDDDPTTFKSLERHSTAPESEVATMHQHLGHSSSSSSESSSSGITTCAPPTPDRQRRARELYELLRALLDEVVPGFDSRTVIEPGSEDQPLAGRSLPSDENVASQNAPSISMDFSKEGTTSADEEVHSIHQPLSVAEDGDVAPPEAPLTEDANRNICQELYDMLSPYFPPRGEQQVPFQSVVARSEAPGSVHSSTDARASDEVPNAATTVQESKEFQELQAQHDTIQAENEGLHSEVTRLLSSLLEANQAVDSAASEKEKLEQELLVAMEDLSKQKEKYKEAKRTIEAMYREGLGLPESHSQQDQEHTGEQVAEKETLHTPRHSLMGEASEQLRQTMEEFKEQRSILRAEISMLEEQKARLQREVMAVTTTPSVMVTPRSAPSVGSSGTSRRSGVRARGERESTSDDDEQVEDADEDYVEIEDTRSSKKDSSKNHGRSLSLVGSAATSGSGAGGAGSSSGRPYTRQAKRSSYVRSRSTASTRRRSEVYASLQRVPQLEADIKICKDGILSETLLSSKTMLTEDQVEKIQMTNKASHQGLGGSDDGGDNKGEDEVWSLCCDFRVKMVPAP